MQDTNNSSYEPKREPYEKPVCRVNMFTVEDSLMISGGSKNLHNAEPGGGDGGQHEDSPWG